MRKYLLGVGAAAVVALAGCGGGDTGDTSSNMDNARNRSTTAGGAGQVSHNDQDIAFSQGMIPHHQHAVDMAEMAGAKATSASVRDLAGRIGGAQDAEIQQLTGMLEQWGAPEPTESGMAHGEMSGAEMGMMTADEMRQLEQATGADFDRMWVQMIKHHQGALTMARTQLEQGENADAKALAQKILDTQEAEITEMEALPL